MLRREHDALTYSFVVDAPKSCEVLNTISSLNAILHLQESFFVIRSASARIVGPAVLTTVLAAFTMAAPSRVTHEVRQKGKVFLPGEVALRQGETIIFINDDGQTTHHAYVEAEQFSFGLDTGDQEPGSKVEEAFTTKGTFNVLCGIHPKMKLTVKVY